MLSIFAIFLFVDSVSAYNNGVARTPAMGWNTWCSIGKCGTDICNQWEIIQVAEAMKSNGMYDVGYRYINLDDCWTACTRSVNGSIQADANRFPDGIESLANIIHSMGLKLGIYTSAGATTCGSGQRTCPNNKLPPGSYGHYINDTQTFATWKVDYVKIDWCGAQEGNNSGLYNATKQHTEFSNDLNATGRHIWLELCRGYNYPPPIYVSEIANSWRIEQDHHDSWKTTLKAITLAIDATNMSTIYNWGYNDFLMTGGQGCEGDINANITHSHCPGMSDIDYMTEYTFWTIINSPLIVATDIRNMTNIMKKILLNKEVIDINQNNIYRAGEIIPSQTKNDGQIQVWYKQISENAAAIVLFNAQEVETTRITVQFDEIPNMKWTASTKLNVRDLWLQQDIGVFNEKYTSSNVKPHGVQLITASVVL